MRWRLTSTVSLIALLSFGCSDATAPAPEPNTSQTRASAQNGTSGPQLDWIHELAQTGRSVDARENVYVGGDDGSVSKYSPDGSVVWTDHIDLEGGTTVDGVAVDSTGVYVAGTEALSKESGRRFFSFDADRVFVRRYDFDGNAIWTEQLRVDAQFSTASSIAVGPEGIYVTGNAGNQQALGAGPGPPAIVHRSERAFVFEMTRDGSLQWTDKFVGGSRQGADATDAVVDSSGVYVSAWSQSFLDVKRAHIRKFDTEGNVIWSTDFGSDVDDEATGVALAAGHVYLSGWTEGLLDAAQSSAGGRDAFLRAFDLEGNPVWTRQFGTESDDSARDVAANARGAFVVGEQASSAFARKYEHGGQLVWTFAFDRAFANRALGVAVHAEDIYVTGASFLAKLSDDVGQPDDCETIEGDVTINSQSDIDQLADIDGCFRIARGLFVQNTQNITDLSFLSGLRSVGGYVGISDNAALESLQGLEGLESIGEGLVIEGNPELETIVSLSSLETVEGEIHIFGNPSLRAIEFAALVSAKELLIAGNNALLTVSAPELTTVEQRLFIVNNDVLEEVLLPALQSVGALTVRHNPELDDGEVSSQLD